MRLLLLGKDRPGIVSCATFILANNGVNIEGAKMISRGELFDPFDGGPGRPPRRPFGELRSTAASSRSTSSGSHADGTLALLASRTAGIAALRSRGRMPRMTWQMTRPCRCRSLLIRGTRR